MPLQAPPQRLSRSRADNGGMSYRRSEARYARSARVAAAERSGGGHAFPQLRSCCSPACRLRCEPRLWIGRCETRSGGLSVECFEPEFVSLVAQFARPRDEIVHRVEGFDLANLERIGVEDGMAFPRDRSCDGRD